MSILPDTMTGHNFRHFFDDPPRLPMSAQIDANAGRTGAPRLHGQPDDQTVSELERLQLRHDFSRWVPFFVAMAGIAFAFVADSVDDWICGYLILLAAALPAYIWARRLVLGIPILPVVAVLYFVFYGLPFITGHPLTKDYSFDEKAWSALTVVSILLIATGFWFVLARAGPPRLTTIKVIPQLEANSFFIFGLGLGCLFQINALFGLVGMSSEIFGILRAILLSLGMISLFALGYQFGAGKLQRARALVFICGLTAYLLLNIATLYLISAMEMLLLAVFGYFLGGGKVPWKLLVAGLMTLVVLSAGKKDIRADYWAEGNPSIATLPAGVTMLAQWVEYGIDNLLGASNAGDPAVSLLDRASITQLVLKVETETPESVPFLNGSSYLAIPGLLIPRIVWPERPSTQDTLKELSQHYGLLTLEEAEATSIGWGLIAEAYANFGIPGCIGLAIFLGLVVGLAQRWCGRAPILSARGLFGLLLIVVMLRVETNAAQTISAWMQSMVPLIMLTWLKMRDVEVML